jgi:ABC-type glycerol-3-phosphate transport system permease component
MPVATSPFEIPVPFSRDWDLTSIGSVVMVIPHIVLCLLLQRRFSAGLTQGAQGIGSCCQPTI